MANQVLLKKSSVSSRVPQTSDLEYGELAINYADGKLYFKTSTNTIDYFPSTAASTAVTSVNGETGDVTVVTEPEFDIVARSGTVSALLTPLLQSYMDWDDYTFRNQVAFIEARTGTITVTG